MSEHCTGFVAQPLAELCIFTGLHSEGAELVYQAAGVGVG